MLRKTIYGAAVIVFLLAAITAALSNLSTQSASGLKLVGWLQQKVGVLQDEYIFESCFIRPPLGVIAYAIRYEDGGRTWSFGMWPSTQAYSPEDLKFQMLSSNFGSPDVVLSHLPPQQIAGIRVGKERCVVNGGCVEVPNALGSGKDGLLIGVQHPQNLVVPDIALSATLYQQKIDWLKCE